MNYAELVAAVSSFTENTFETVDMNTFIEQTEQRIYNSVQLPSLRKNVTGALAINNKYLACPDDFLSVYSLAIVDPVTGAHSFLLNKDVNFLREAYPVPTATGVPKFYALFGPRTTMPAELTFMVAPTPDKAYSAELHYFFYPESIITANTTWLGDNFDSALLNGCLEEAARFMKAEQDIVALYQQRFTQSMALLKNLSDGKQRGDAYRNGQTRVQVS